MDNEYKADIIGIGEFGSNAINYMLQHKNEAADYCIVSEDNTVSVLHNTLAFIITGPDTIDQTKEVLENLNDTKTICLVTGNQEELREYADVVIAVKEDLQAIDTIVRTIITPVFTPQFINIDLDDLMQVLDKAKHVYIGTGKATGKNKAIKATYKAYQTPLTADSLSDISKVLVNITGGTDVELMDANLALDELVDTLGEDVDMMLSICIDDKFDQELEITIIAS